MTEFGRPVDESSSIVLNFLKPVKKVFLGTRKKSVAVAGVYSISVLIYTIQHWSTAKEPTVTFEVHTNQQCTN